MPIINVVQAFMLKDENNRLTEYKVGRYEVDAATAEHWYVVAHCEGFENPAPRPGTLQYAQAELLAAQASRLNEGVEEQGQKPAVTPSKKAERVFAGKDLPKPTDPGMTAFIDPSTRS